MEEIEALGKTIAYHIGQALHHGNQAQALHAQLVEKTTAPAAGNLVANGSATLGAGGKVTIKQRPAMKKLAGILCLTPMDADPATFEAWGNQAVDAVCLHQSWKALSPDGLTLTMGPLTGALAFAEKEGKQLLYSVSTGIDSPTLPGARMITLTAPAAGVMPLPWDQSAALDWMACVRAMGAVFDAHPNLAGVVMAGVGQEVNCTLAEQEPDITAFENAGFPEGWIDWVKELIDVYAAAFPTTPFYLAVAKPTPSPDGLNALEEVCAYGAAAYPGHFGVLNPNLTAICDRSNPVVGLVPKYAETNPAGFFLETSSVGFENKAGKQMTLGGSLAATLKNGESLGADVIGVYDGDCALPANAAVLSAASTALKNQNAA
jgi:hypothetical protein